MIIQMRKGMSKALRKLKVCCKIMLHLTFIHTHSGFYDHHFSCEVLTNHIRLNSHFGECDRMNGVLDYRLLTGKDYIACVTQHPAAFSHTVCNTHLMLAY